MESASILTAPSTGLSSILKTNFKHYAFVIDKLYRVVYFEIARTRSRKEERAGCFALFVFLVSRDCCVTLLTMPQVCL